MSDLPPISDIEMEAAAEYHAERQRSRLNGNRHARESGEAGRSSAPLVFKSAARFCAEYVPLDYTVEPIIRSASLYTNTAKTGAGKTAFNVIAALAVATGRSDILNREVRKGRVVYLACENPDDIRMRLKIAAWTLNIDLDEIGDDLIVLERRERPEDICASLARLAEEKPFALVIVDTLAAFFDGDNINDAVQGGQFMRRLRPLTQIAGLPSVIVAAHPVKNAGEDALIPYGSGAILNEVDGNLTLWKHPDTGIVSLHWQGKLRGIEFQPPCFRFEELSSPEILDAKGREVLLPMMRPASEEAAEDREASGADKDRALLLAIVANPRRPIREYAAEIGLAKTNAERRLERLEKQKLVERVLGKWAATKKGLAAVQPTGTSSPTTDGKTEVFPGTKKSPENQGSVPPPGTSPTRDKTGTTSPATPRKTFVPPGTTNPGPAFSCSRVPLSLSKGESGPGQAGTKDRD